MKEPSLAQRSTSWVSWQAWMHCPHTILNSWIWKTGTPDRQHIPLLINTERGLIDRHQVELFAPHTSPRTAQAHSPVSSPLSP